MSLTTLIPLVALAAVPALHAQVTIPDGELLPAEKSYVLNCLATSVDGLISNLVNPLEDTTPNLHIRIIERELKRTDVPHKGLSEAQIAFLEEERKIQMAALKEMEGKDEATQQEIFHAMQETLRVRVDKASLEILRICGVSDTFQAVADEVQLDAKIREIMQPTEAAGENDKKALVDAVNKLKSLAASLRELAKA